MRANRMRGIAAGVLAMSLVAAACGSDEDTAESTATPTTAAPTSESSAPASESTEPASESSAPGTESSAPASDIDRTGETIKIGIVSQDAGPIPFPEMTAGVEVAIDKINSEGGINGATLEPVYCSVEMTPESTINCANQMIEEDVVLTYITLDFVVDAGLPIYQEAGIPLISGDGTGPGVESAESGVHLLHGAAVALPVGGFKLLSDLGITKVTFSHGNNPAAENFALNVSAPVAEPFGIDLEFAVVDEAAPDFAALVATAQANGSEAIFTVTSEQQCNALISAAKAADFDGPIVAGNCTNFLSELGPDAVGVYSVMTQYQPDVEGVSDEVRARLDEFQTLMTDAGYEDYSVGQGVFSFGALIEISSVLRLLDGEITAETVDAAFDQDAVIVGWFGPDMNCGVDIGFPQYAAHCSDSVSTWVVEEIDGENRRVQIDDFFDASDALG